MPEKKEKDTRQKIFDAALSLFAERGYNAVGIREIAKNAGANVAMINYYFGGKIGILQEIVNKAHELHRHAIASVDKNLDPEQHILAVINNFIQFFRDNTELALVAFDTLIYNIPEILDLKKKWDNRNLKLLEVLFANIGLDIENKVQVSIFNGFLGNTILTHFRGCYFWEKSKKKRVCAHDDAFYERYAETLRHFYFNGVLGLVRKKKQRQRSRKKSHK